MNAREKAAAYLSRGSKTRWQVIKYLRDKGYEESDIEDAVSELMEYHFIDDLNFSKMYFELGFDKGRGALRIKRELSEKGVDQDIIEEALSELEEVPDQYEMAMEIGGKVVSDYDLQALDYNEKQKLMAKIVRKLAGRGFSADVSYSVAKSLVNR